jgi:fructoselysine-6-P-deglycase FrlB-like protein
MAAGEAVVMGMMRAVEKGTPFILFAASGGRRALWRGHRANWRADTRALSRVGTSCNEI